MGNDEELKFCWSHCEFRENRSAFLAIAIVFGSIYAVSMILLAGVIKERRQIGIPTPNFPGSLYLTSCNFPLRRFLIPAMLETAITYVLFPFLPYFVQYILNPITYCSDDTEYYNKLRCRSTYWIGFIVLAYVTGSLISLPLWFTAVRTLQKKSVWVISSILQIVALPLMALPKDKYMIVAMVIFFVIGITQGSSYLQRSILSDIIDYDEFLVLRRNEGIYTGIIEGLSKLTIVLVQIIPFTFMYIAGYEEPIMGVPREQSYSVEVYLQCVKYNIITSYI